MNVVSGWPCNLRYNPPNLASQIFGNSQGNQTVAGKRALKWLNSGNKIVVGGKQLREMYKHGRFRNWFETVQQKGRAVRVSNDRIDDAARWIQEQRPESDDPHLLALAAATDTKMLFTDDKALGRDFRRLLNGNVFSSDMDRQQRDRVLRHNTCLGPCR